MQKKIQLSLISVALISQLQAANTIELEPITVTSATKTKQSIKDVTSNVSVITSEEIEEKNFTTVAEALNTLSGVSFTNNGGLGQSTSVKVRGLDSKRVLVLIDGVRYNDLTGTSGAPFAHLMISDIKQIEVVKGAQSGVWGADATAGVINIITKGAEQGLHGSFNAEYGSFATKKYGGSASYKTDNYYVKASYQKVDSNSFSAQAPRGSDIDAYEKDGYTNNTSTVKLGFNINETNKIDISHTMIDADGEYDGFNSPNAFYTSKTEDSFTNINFNHIDSFNEVDIHINRSKFDRDYPQGFTKEFDGEVYEYGIKSNISYNKKDFVLVGGDYKTFEHENTLEKKYNNKAFFVSNSNELDGFLGEKTILTESLRFDSYNEFDNKTTGKVGIKNYSNLTKGLIFSANIGTAYNVPTPYNLYSNYGNADLKPEDTTSYDLSVEYKDIKATYFSSVISDMIDYDFSILKYNNISGKSKVKGLELEYSTALNDDILLNANFTRTSAKNSSEQSLARIPNWTAKAGLDYYGINDLHLGLNGEYVGKRYNSDNEQGAQTGKYALVNFNANYDINKDLMAYVKIDNLFDKYYQVVDGYATAPLSGYIGIKAKF
ncbi:TonB-dependent receptor plug domain-containing protein [Sulfurimonas sp.]